jgi:probable phosphoglycerate mutase
MTNCCRFLDSYEHHSIDEPAILLGGAFVVNSAEEEIAEAAKN